MELGCDPDVLDRLAAYHDQLQQRLRVLASTLTAAASSRSAAWTGADGRRWWSDTEALVIRIRSQAIEHTGAARELRRHGHDQRRASQADPDHAVTLLDRRGDGRIVQRVGPAKAATVVVIVPGVGTDLWDRERLHSDAEHVWRTIAVGTAGQGTDLAVVSWLGYNPPDSVPAGIQRRPAVEGALQLAADIDQLRAGGAERVVLIGHSYGAVTAARAAAVRGHRSAGPDELILLGSPGLPVGFDELHLAPGARLWSATATGDPIALVARTGVVHGSDPSVPAQRLPTSLDGHGAYLRDPVLLDAIGRLVADR